MVPAMRAVPTAFAIAAPFVALLLACKDPPAPPVAERAAAPAAEPVVEDLAATEPPAAPAAVLKTVSFPGGDLAIPESWSPKTRVDPPMTAVHVMPVPGMTCDLAVLEGHGTKKQAEEYLAAGANAYQGDVQRAPDIEVGGHVFQGIHVTKPRALPDSADAVVEVYAAITSEDLVGIGVTRLEQSGAVEEGRRACLQAFAQLTTALPRATPTGD
jgi:hypothetical protein